MILELFIIFEIVMIAVFFASFFFKQEIMWVISILLSGFLMLTSWNVERFAYVFNTTTSAYDFVTISYSYPYLMAVNMIFFSLGLLLFLFDLWDKYGAN